MEQITVKMQKLKSGWIVSTAYDSNGNVLLYADGTTLGHSSSSEDWARHDMIEFKKERYNELFPNGWEVNFEFIDKDK